MKNHRIAALLGFVAGFVDTAGFLGLQGLFTAHVTGNFVTLGAALVLGTHGVVAKCYLCNRALGPPSCASMKTTPALSSVS
jgi:uncharacterized membrane protein YoaK (UPF0700 family)